MHISTENFLDINFMLYNNVIKLQKIINVLQFTVVKQHSYQTYFESCLNGSELSMEKYF